MKKIIAVILIIFCFIPNFSAFSQTSISAAPEQKISAEMTVPASVRPGSGFTVEIKITKGNISGLGRFQQFLAQGMTALQLENSGADFLFENQNVKFIWVSLPLQEILTVKYKVAADASLTGTKTLSGTFSYVENGRTKTFTIVPKEISMDPKAAAEEPAAETAEHKPEIIPPLPPDAVIAPPAESNQADEKIIAEQSVVVPGQNAPELEASAAPASKEKVFSNVTEEKEPVSPSLSSGTSASAAGIIFRVQIAATSEKYFKHDGYFQKKLGIKQTVYTEENNGLTKYCIGNFSTYNEAHMLRDEIISKAEGAFVVAFKNGMRISVSEALEAAKKN